MENFNIINHNTAADYLRANKRRTKILFPVNDTKNLLRRVTKALANAVKNGGGATKMEVDINDRLDAQKRALVDAAYLERGWKVLKYRTVDAVDRCYNGRIYLVVEFVG